MELRRYLALMWRWSWLIVVSAILAGATAFLISRQTTPTYAASATLLINQMSADNALPDYNSLLADERLARTYAELLSKRPVLDVVIANLNLNIDADTLARRINVSAIRDTQLLMLTVEDTNPQRAADIADEIISVFSQHNRELQASRYTTSKQSLQKELANVQADIDRTQASLDALKVPTSPEQLAEQNRLQALLANYRASYTTVLKSFEGTHQELANVQADIDRTQASLDALKVPTSKAPTSPEQLAEQNRLQALLAEQRNNYGTLLQGFEEVRAELANIQTDIDHTQASLDALKVPTSPEQLAEQNRLQALLANYRASYTTLLDSLEKMRLAESQTTDDVNVVEAAQPGKTAVRPRILLNTLLGAIVATMLTIGGLFLREYFNDTVKSGEEVDALMGVSALAAIARIEGKDLADTLVTVTDTHSPNAEAYRRLAANIDFSAIDRPITTLVVISGSSREGKSTTVANLAIAIAQTGKRVILVDTDLRRPVLHAFFQRTKQRGLTTALLQRRGDMAADYLVPTEVDNMYLMPSGPLPPNPAELLGSQRMTELIEELKAQADLVLFDSPPLLGVVDAALLAHACDATLLVILAGSTRREALTRAKEQLTQSGARLLGVVLNRVSTPRRSYNDYYGQSKRHNPHVRRRGFGLPFRHSRNGSDPDSSEELDIDIHERTSPGQRQNGNRRTE